MIVDLFIPCFVDQLFPETGINMVKVLEKLGCEVHYNRNQTCCGQPAFVNGHWEEAKALGKKFLKDCSGTDHYIVTPGGVCMSFIRNYYQGLFQNSAEHNEAKTTITHFYEFSEFLVNVLHITNVGAKLNAKATFHDGCAAHFGCGIKDQPRQLLKNVEGLVFTEMEASETCCGFGGMFALEYEAISTMMAYSKVEKALATGADYIISTDSYCFIHLKTYIEAQKIKLKTLHIADVLASGW